AVRGRASAAAAACHRSLAVAQELARVDHAPVLPDLEMHVCTGRAAAGTGPGHLLPGADQVAGAHGQPRVVRISGDIAVAVVDLDGVAITAAIAGEADHAVGHRHHRIADPGVEIDTLVELPAATERVCAAAEAGRDVAAPHRRTRRHRVDLQLAIEQQRLHHRQLLPGLGELEFDLVQPFDQLAQRHVAGELATTLAGGALEVELAVLQLSGLGQALAQGIEPVGLGLQLAQARSQGVDLLLRLLAHLLQLTLLLRQLRFHALGGRRADSGAGADAQAHADRQDRNQCRPRPLRRPLLQAALPSGSLRAPRVSYDEFVAHALGMSDSKPNARRPATPRPAVEAALADDAGAPLRRALWLDALD